MTTGKIVKAINIDSNKLKLSDTIKTNKYQGKSVYSSYDGNAFRVQLPMLNLPFGVGKYNSPDTNEIKYSLDLSMKDVDSKIFENFNEIEEKILEYAEKNSKELFKKQQSKAILKEFYKPFIKHHEDENGERSGKYPPRFKAKMWTNGNDFAVDVYDSKKVDGKYVKIPMNIENADSILSPGSKCEAIIQSSGLWVVGKSFGISWSVIQIKAYTNENTLNGYAFEDDEEQEEEQEVEQHQEEFNEADLELEEEISISTAVPKRQRRKKEEF